MPRNENEVPHVWHTTDSDGGDCRHLAMGSEGAIQAHLLHHGMMGFNGELNAEDEGKITVDTKREEICFDSHCVLYGLSFDKQGGC
jgi:hypothetical protein